MRKKAAAGAQRETDEFNLLRSGTQQATPANKGHLSVRGVAENVEVAQSVQHVGDA